jgi:hypothetical protein
LAIEAFAISAPLTSRIATSGHSSVTIPVTKKLIEKPQNPSSSTGRRPKRSESAPSTGEAKKFATANVNVIAPNQNACSAWLAVKCPTSTGMTGMMMPIDIMSISVVTMMKRIAALRRGFEFVEIGGVKESSRFYSRRRAA